MIEQKTEVCKNCAYAAARSGEIKTFPWCKYECKYTFSDAGNRHIKYKYEHDSCDHFLPADKPTQG